MNIAPTKVEESTVEVDRWNDDVHGKVTWRTIISADRTTSRDLICGIAYFEADGILRLHRHAQAEIVHVLDGCGQARVGNQTFSLEKGDTVFVPGNTPHEFAASLPGLKLYYVFHADGFEEIVYDFELA